MIIQFAIQTKASFLCTRLNRGTESTVGVESAEL